MADLAPQKIKITFTPRSRDRTATLSPITFPATIIVDDTTGGFRVNVTVNGEQRTIAAMRGAYGFTANDGKKIWSDKIEITKVDFSTFTGVDSLIEHLEETNNLGDLRNTVDENYRRELVEVGIQYGDSKQGLLQAKAEASKIFNENGTVEGRNTVILSSGHENYATKPSPEIDTEESKEKIGELVDPDSEDPVVESNTPFNDFAEAFERLNIGSNGGGKDLGDDFLYYPEDLDINIQDFMKFESFVYQPQELSFAGVARESGVGNIKDGPTVYLPINNAQDSNTVGWNNSNANPLQLGLFRAAYDTIGTELENLGNLFSDIAVSTQKLVQRENMLAPAVKTYFAGQAAGVTGMLSRTQGAVLNPNLVLLFNNPDLRTFSFSFRFSARDAKEATQVRRIIRFFKQTMATKRSSTELFLMTPSVFKIGYYQSGNNIHKSIGQIKTCALTGCNVNYVPDGTYMTFDDPARTMTSYEMTLSFGELEPIYRDEYNMSVDEIGF